MNNLRKKEISLLKSSRRILRVEKNKNSKIMDRMFTGVGVLFVRMQTPLGDTTMN